MVTVRLSEPPSLHVNTDVPPNMLPTRRSIFGPECTPTSAVATSASEAQLQTPASDNGDAAEIKESVPVPEPKRKDEDTESIAESPRGTRIQDTESIAESPRGTRIQDTESIAESPRGTRIQKTSLIEDDEDSDPEEVNWDELQRTEDEQSKSKDQDDNSTAMLLARLEQENNKLAINPKSVKVNVVEQPATRRPRPPSMAQLREMAHGPTPMALRYSVVPPPPMTDLEFYMALVKDYQQTAARLPTLLSRKIRSGIPPPLRGVVWQSMAQAGDTTLLEHFERLSGESSPYEGIIGKDLGRSFPGVDMFRDPDGDGQRMLGRVLKCFSLYDQKIGYCQGLAFLVGPLLMHMPDNQAFCVLVRLMENYDLRSCFLPDLSGLQVRIYQFRELLRQHFTAVSNHLEELQVDPTYVSQWFLSFFATTCPLPMLFRIYDVIFAEGASETIMRVALSLMQKNESRILACTELEDVMHLLLSRGLWDCYHYSADEFVEDFVGLSNVVSRERLAQLELQYREEKVATSNAGRTSAVSNAASRFLGRLWTTSVSVTSPRGALSPGLTAPSRPLSMLRRSTSKQSLASTLNSVEASSSSILSTTFTDATAISRDSSTADANSIRESAPVAPKSQGTSNTQDKSLHNQIEDLLTALSELQRNHALLATQLQSQQEEREEDQKAVRSLLDGLKRNTKRDSTDSGNSSTEDSDDSSPVQMATDELTTPELRQLVENVEERFGSNNPGHARKSSMAQTKAQLREQLERTKEHLMIETSKTRESERRVNELTQEASNLREELRESHSRLRSAHQDRQRLEKQFHSMKGRASIEAPTASSEQPGWFSSSSRLDTGAPANGRPGGLKELKLGRSKSTPNTQAYPARNSSIVRTQTEPMTSTISEHETLVLELVQAKTAEAVARQEAEEYKQKLETLRKAYGLAAVDTPPATNSGGLGVFSRLTGGSTDGMGMTSNTRTVSSSSATTPATTPGTAATGGGFWGWRR
ncbi:rab-GTPase-TBC domain-containing protein [Microdochium trichocladiopsis]|uniref:Rab-GTPase-TBC domain-containing protein n=1 Tax=Microdochium trichocladiopsis TaxID=1682393 RepID=A0A9P8YCX4_9PEZI|nr:rab-GTPase-TBC domain-containing protein [Microdochium trichocladiopsis]KAH7035615.1 rab-GTPase-TBC domain-containing protein [Microdochium trichocladiopsis]